MWDGHRRGGSLKLCHQHTATVRESLDTTPKHRRRWGDVIFMWAWVSLQYGYNIPIHEVITTSCHTNINHTTSRRKWTFLSMLSQASLLLLLILRVGDSNKLLRLHWSLVHNSRHNYSSNCVMHFTLHLCIWQILLSKVTYITRILLVNMVIYSECNHLQHHSNCIAMPNMQKNAQNILAATLQCLRNHQNRISIVAMTFAIDRKTATCLHNTHRLSYRNALMH